MTAQEIGYPLRLCVELLHYAGLAQKTQNLTSAEIRDAAGVFFDEHEIDEAVQYLTERTKSEPIVEDCQQ